MQFFCARRFKSSSRKRARAIRKACERVRDCWRHFGVRVCLQATSADCISKQKSLHLATQNLPLPHWQVVEHNKNNENYKRKKVDEFELHIQIIALWLSVEKRERGDAYSWLCTR